jgi:hypothetical protein
MDWYVDSWAVRDGFAFTSYRDADDIKGAERTVFLGVPDLVPVPVGRVSTSLWATRVNFQDRFLDDKGVEIGFANLEQVIELVRRAYLAGGIGPGPAGGEGQEGPTPGENRPGGGEAYLERQLLELARETHWDQQFQPTSDKPRRDNRFQEILRDQKVVNTLYDYLRVFAGATLIKWAEHVRDPANGGVGLADFLRWLQTLYRMDLWGSHPQYWDFVDGYRLTDLLESNMLPIPHPLAYVSWRNWLTSPTHEQIILDVPIPLLPNWHQRIRRLSDKLFLALATYDYFDNNKELINFIPALLAAMAVSVQTEEERFRAVDGEGRLDRLQAALEWLSREMPRIELPPSAESALTQFAWSELDRQI